MARLTTLTRGLTHLEIAMSVALFAAVGLGIVTLAQGKSEDESREALGQATRIGEAAEQWLASEGSCPSLTQLQEAATSGADLASEDPWGGRFRVSCRDGALSVRSAGPDGETSSDDDITWSSSAP
jgi:hypothetical protein